MMFIKLSPGFPLFKLWDHLSWPFLGRRFGLLAVAWLPVHHLQWLLTSDEKFRWSKGKHS